MTFFKIFFSTLLLLIVIAIFAVSSLIFFIDPNQLKPILIAEVTKRTGYILKMDGKLSWAFYPRLGVNVKRMTFTAPNQAAPFIDLRAVNMAVPISSLLNSQWNKKAPLQGEIAIAEVYWGQVRVQNTHVNLTFQNKILTLSPIKAAFYGGTLTGAIRGRDLMTPPTAKWNGDIQFNNVQLQPLLLGISGPNQKLKLSGIGDVKMQLFTQGMDKTALLNNLQGTLALNARQGVIDGIDINYLIKTVDALLSKQPIPPPAHLNQTFFDNLRGSMSIQNGVTKTNNLLLVSSAFTTKAEGTIDLVNQTIYYRLQVIPEKLQKIKWPVPIIVEGPLRSPSVRLDTQALNTMIAKDQLEKVKTKVQEELKELPVKVDKFLQKLMN